MNKLILNAVTGEINDLTPIYLVPLWLVEFAWFPDLNFVLTRLGDNEFAKISDAVDVVLVNVPIAVVGVVLSNGERCTTRAKKGAD